MRSRNASRSYKLQSYGRFRHPRARARPPGGGAAAARRRGQIHGNHRPLVEACLPKDGAGNFIASQERSDVVHDLPAFLAERMLEMNKQKLAWRSRASWAGWRATWAQRWRTSRPRPNCRATTSMITRAFWRCSRRTARNWQSIRPDGSPHRRCGPSSRDRWANCCP